MENATIISTANLSKICRTCLIEYEEMHSIFSEIQSEINLEDEPVFICEILMNISSIRILGEDGLPTMICTNCMELAHIAFKFQQQCNRSKDILETYILQTQDYDINKVQLTKEDDEVLELINSSLTSANEELLQNVDEEINIIAQNALANENGCIEEASIIINNSINNAITNVINDSINNTIITSIENSVENCHSNELCAPDLIKLEDNHVNESNIVDIKLEIKDESALDTIKTAASEDNVRLRERLAIKRLETDVKVKKTPSNCGHSNYTVKYNEDGEKYFQCNFCEKSYKHASSLKIHMRSHTLERPYTCTHCGKGFKQYGALTYHLRSHTGEQPFACKICGKKYRQSGTLTAHMRVHTGQKPYLCSVCGRGFRQAPDLGYHMRTHTKERPYMCNVCGKRMRMQCHLVQHMRIHTGERPFQCTECNKAFPSSTRLKRHAIIHTDLKPFTCEVCNKSFNRLSSLRVHAKIHTDERPHVCSFCGKGFIQAHALRCHLHTHTNTDQDNSS